MPLLIEGKPMTKTPSSIASFFEKYPHFKESAAALCSQEIRTVGPKGLLYVGQREVGGTVPEDDVIHTLGTDDATTCHIGVIRHTGSCAICIAHFDGCNTKQGLTTMLDIIMELSVSKPEGRVELHLFGGFSDEKGYSEKLSIELLKILRCQECEIHLQTACITDLNTVYKNGIPFPVFYGLAVDVKTREMFKANFTDKGPDLSLRGARHFTGGREMLNIYDNKSHNLTIGPFSYDMMYDIDQWCRVPDTFIRQRLSTSPAQEPPHFEASVRASLIQIRDHPKPLSTMFPGGKARLYKKAENGQWIKL